MTKFISNIALGLLIFINCGSDANISKENEVLPNVLTLKFVLNDETVGEDDYLISKPKDIAVKNNGDIMILDEDMIKVFDDKGMPKEIIGGPGQGPGEFENSRRLNLSESQYFSIYSSQFIHFFDADNSYMTRIKLRENERVKSDLEKNSLEYFYPTHSYLLGENRLLYAVLGVGKDRNVNHSETLLYYDDNGKIELLNKSVETSKIAERGVGMVANYPFLGSLLINFLPDNKIIYMHSEHDTKVDKDGSNKYTLKILSMDNLKETIIEHNFVREEITQKPYDSLNKFLEKYKTDGEMVRYVEYTTEKLKERKFQASLQNILVDGNTIFAFTFTKNEKGEYLTDIFDAEKMEYVKSVYFSVVPNVIKNKIAYRLNTGKDFLPEVEIYNIDPVIYKK